MKIPVSFLINTDQLPEELNFITGGIISALSNIYYEDYRVHQDLRGQNLSYSLSLLVDKDLSLEIPGAGIKLRLNPNYNGSAPTSIPLRLHVHTGALRYVKYFKFETFAGGGENFIRDLAKNVIAVDDITLTASGIHAFITAALPVQQFVNDVNVQFGVNFVYDITKTESENLVNAVDFYKNTSLLNPWEILLATYIVQGSPNDVLENAKKLLGVLFYKTKDYSSLPVPSPEKLLINYFIPKLSASVIIEPAIEFTGDYIKPVDAQGDVDTQNPYVLYGPEIEFYFNTLGKIGFQSDFITVTPSHPKFQIGNTGLLVGLDKIKLDLSRNSNIPEATADGRPNDFIGVYIQDAEIYLPKKWFGNQGSPSIFGHNLLIGTGGISGTIGIDDGGVLQKQLGSFNLELDQFDLTFHQNAITHSHIHGNIEFTKFQMETAPGSGVFVPAKVELDGAIDEEGNFHITASTNAPITAIRIPGVLAVKVSSFEVGKQDDRFYAEVAGQLDFLWDVPGLGNILPKEIDIKKLRIWEDGKIEFAIAGVSLLPKPVTLPLGPVKITVSALTIGSHEQEHGGVNRKYTVVGFDGGVSVNPGGVDVRANGVKIYFTTDGGPLDIFLRIQGIKVDIRISSSDSESNAKVLISGWLAIKEPDPNVPDDGAGDEFMGGVSIKLNKLGIAATAGMRMRPKVPAFLVDLSLELPNAIPLGSTGLGIYGFRGLIGTKYVADKTAIPGLTSASPWWMYYKGKIPMDYKEGVQVSKFKQRSGFSFGAGASLATQTDKGKTFSSKLFFLLSLPDVFLLQGQAAILRNRIGLDDTTDPPFYALLAFTSHSIEIALGVNYKIPEDSGAIADINGLLEMGFFWGNNAAWYINIGVDSPEERRVRAKIVSLFNVYFYFMLNSQGIRAGAGASWKFKKSLGPVGIEASAYMDTAGRISFHPKQLGGYMAVGGSLKVRVFKFKFGFSLDAMLSGEAPKPFIITGTFTFKINLPWPFKDIKVKLELTWSFNNSLDTLPLPVVDVMSLPASAVNVHTREKFSILVKDGTISTGEITEHHVIPMDSFIDIEFLHGLYPTGTVTSKIGGVTSGSDNIELVSPQKAKSLQVRHTFEVTDVAIKFWNGSAWAAYNVYEAATPLHDLQLFPNNTGTWYQNLKQGYFQLDKPKRYNKIRLLAQTPFSYFNQGGQMILPEELNINVNTLFCEDHPVERTCVNFDVVPTEGQPLPNYSYPVFNFSGLMPEIAKQFGGMVFYVTAPAGSGNIVLEAPVVEQPAHGYTKALAIAAGNNLEIYLPTDCAEVRLYLSTGAANATIEFYQLVDATPAGSPVPVFSYVLLSAQTVTATNLLNGPVDFVYNPLFPDQKVNKVLIIANGNLQTPVTCDPPLVQQTQTLEQFLSQLAAKGCFANPVNELFPTLDPDFNGFFQNTVLYGVPMPSTVINNEIDYKDSVKCNFRVYDNKGFNCNFNLEMLTTTSSMFAYDMIVQFQALVPDPNAQVHGANFAFMVTALLNNGRIAMIRGTSCYAVQMCREQESTYLHDICYKSYDDYLIDLTIPSQAVIQNDFNLMVDTLNNTVQPMWRPNTFFTVELSVNDKMSWGNSSSANPKVIRLGFKTKGPIGQFHQWKDNPGGGLNNHPDFALLKGKDRELEFKLVGLQHYIDYSKSYPNADGNILSAKPLFYKNPSLLLFYTEPYTMMFFRDWDKYPSAGSDNSTQSRLEVMIKDPQESNPGVSGTPPLNPVAASWLEGGDLQMTSDVTVLNNMNINGNPCFSSTNNINLEQEIYSAFQLGNGIDSYLKPMKLYHALFNLITNYAAQGEIATTVHKYAFQTSRYIDFEEQVQSYILSSEPGNERYAIFELIKDFGTGGDLGMCQQIVDGTLPDVEPLNINYAETLDKLLDGAMMLGALQAATTTEFNIIRNTAGGGGMGILIRNPEPFNDPKLPEELLYDANNNPAAGGALEINFSSSAGLDSGTTGDPKVIYSKDRSKIFITFPGMNLYAGSYEFRFRYFLYDGHQYGVNDTQNVTITVN